MRKDQCDREVRQESSGLENEYMKAWKQVRMLMIREVRVLL